MSLQPQNNKSINDSTPLVNSAQESTKSRPGESRPVHSGGEANREALRTETSDDEEMSTSEPEPVKLNSEGIPSQLNNAVFIILMGVTGTGKSTFVSLLADQDVGVGHSLASCTSDIGIYSCHGDNGQTVFLVDTPGFDDTNRSDTEILKEIAYFLGKMYEKRAHLAGIVYLHRITDPRMNGTALKNLRMLQRLCGDRGLPNVLLTTTMWTALIDTEEGRMIGTKREQELQDPELWGGMVSKGSKIVRHDGTLESAQSLVSSLVSLNTAAVLDIQVQLVDENKALDETPAGKYVQGELLEARKRFEKDIEEYQDAMEAAAKEKDQETLEALQKEREIAVAMEKQRIEEWKKLSISMKELAQDKDSRYQELAEQMAQQLPDTHDDSDQTAELLTIQRQLEKLQDDMRDGERRHELHVARLQSTQQAQAIAEIQRVGRQARLREEQLLMEKKRLQMRLRRLEEDRANQGNEFPIISLLKSLVGSMASLGPGTRDTRRPRHRQAYDRDLAY